MKRSLNLMSERSRRREQIRSCVRLWTRIVIAVTLLLTCVGIAKWRACHQQQQRVASAEAEYEPIRQLKIENGRLKKQIESIRQAERIPLELSKHRPLLGLVGLATKLVADQDDKIYLHHIEIERDTLVIEPREESTLEFALEGISNDDDAITALADALREDGPFVEVKLTTSSASATGQQANQQFTIQCTN